MTTSAAIRRRATLERENAKTADEADPGGAVDRPHPGAHAADVLEDVAKDAMAAESAAESWIRRAWPLIGKTIQHLPANLRAEARELLQATTPWWDSIGDAYDLWKAEPGAPPSRLEGLVEAATIVCAHCRVAQGVDPAPDLTGRSRPALGPPKRIGTWRYPYRHRACAGEREWPCEASKIWERIGPEGPSGGG